jgi:probable HAF family extracellular repeat protein
MRKAHPYLRLSFRATLTLFIALLLGAIALLSLGTKPAETKPDTPKPLYIVRDLGTLGGSFSMALNINNADQVVGGANISSEEEHAFLWQDDGDPNTNDMKDLGVLPGRALSIAWGINNADQVVGSSEGEGVAPHPFLYSGGVMRDLNTLIPPNSGWELLEALDINDNGHIVGRGITKMARSMPSFWLSQARDNSLYSLASGYLKSEATPRDSTATVDSIEETATDKGGLCYNAGTDGYEYDWEVARREVH